MSSILLEMIIDLLKKTVVGIAVKFAVDALSKKINEKRRPGNKG